MRIYQWSWLIVALCLDGVSANAQPVTDEQTICFFFDEAATIRSHYGTGVIVGYIVVNPLWVGGQWAEHLQRWTSTFYWEAEADGGAGRSASSSNATHLADAVFH